MSILCKVFGHKRPSGYGNTYPGYGRAFRFATDGTGTEHWSVREDCDRCGHGFTVAKFHKEPRP